VLGAINGIGDNLLLCFSLTLGFLLGDGRANRDLKDVGAVIPILRLDRIVSYVEIPYSPGLSVVTANGFAVSPCRPARYANGGTYTANASQQFSILPIENPQPRRVVLDGSVAKFEGAVLRP
jgi:hypothetical protein